MADVEVSVSTPEAVLIEIGEHIVVGAPAPVAVLVEADQEIVTITRVPEAFVVEVGLQGPAGPQGVRGDMGPGGDLAGLLGSDTGDIIRWNASTRAWESQGEPFEFQGIILTPMGSPLSAVEGSLYYKAADNSLYVQVD